MAKTVTPPVPSTTAERLASYRAAARSIAPRAPADETSFAETIGKLGASSRNFFTDVRAVYVVERAQHLQ